MKTIHYSTFTRRIFLALVLSFVGWMNGHGQTTVPFFVSNETELDAALTAAVNDDVIVFLNDIVITSQKTISAKTITINGQGYELSVPVPGLDDMGRFNSNPSAFRVFQLSSSANVTINDLTMKGGVANSNGGAILVNSGTTLNINNSVVSNTNAGPNNGGGGIAVLGTMFMKNSFVRRNAARYGGGILVTSTGRAYVEESTMVENRSTATNGGGGAAECQSGSIIFFNNSTLSNNQSTEIGGAINNYQGTVYFINSSATGNVAFGSFEGGAIGNNGGNVYILNSLFAHNYRRTSGSVTNPTGYVLDDFHRSPSGIRIYHSVYHATLPTGLAVNTGNVQYTGVANGSDNSIFSGGLLSKITDNDGNEIGDQIFRPFLFNNQGSVAPTLQVGSFVSQTANLGVPTRFSNNNNSNPAIAYFSGGTWTNLLGTSASGQEVTTDQVGDTRSSTEPARGAIEAELNATLFIVKVNGASGGTVNGGTIYGDVYPEGTSVTLTAIPNSGQQFVSWDFVAGGTGTASTSNPYTFTVTQDVTLVPVFSSSGGNFSITYIGNGNTRGTVPAVGSFSSSQTISGPGSLGRRGFAFDGWNTNSNGSGTSYAENDASGTDNLTLYAQWSQISDLQDLIIASSGSTPTIAGNKFVAQGAATSTIDISSINSALANGDLVLQARNITVSSDISANTRGLILEANNKVTIGATISVDELVTDAMEFEVEPGSSVNVIGTFNNRMTSGSLVLKADANGYSQIKFGSMEGRSSVTQQKNLHAGWNMVGAPMNASNADFFGSVGTSTGFPTVQNLFSWNGQDYVNVTNNNTTITPGMGYFGFVGNFGIRPAGVESFTGTPNTSVTVPTLYSTSSVADNNVTMSNNVTDREGWNLLANPFTCNLDISGVPRSADFNNAFYLYDGTNYTAIAPGGIDDGVVPPLSSFWMQASGTFPTLGSAGAMTMSDNGTISNVGSGFARPAFDRLVLRTHPVGDTIHTDYTVVSFIDGTTDGFDGAWDGHKMLKHMDYPNIFSTHTDGSAMAINAIPYGPNHSEKRTVPISFKAAQHGQNFSIRYDDSYMINHYAVYLEDKLLQTFTDLSAQDYSFINDTSMVGRFVLHFRAGSLSIDAPESTKNASGISAWVFDNHAYLNPQFTGNAMLTLYDISGKKLQAERIKVAAGVRTEWALRSGLAAGVYLFRVETAVGTETIKFTR